MQTVVAEVVTALAVPRGLPAVAATTPAADTIPAIVQEGPGPQEEQVAELTVCSLLYGESGPKNYPLPQPHPHHLPTMCLTNYRRRYKQGNT